MENLTPTEKRVLDLTIKGLSSKEIGRKLGSSHRTVEIHRCRIFRKCNVKNSKQLMHLHYTTMVNNVIDEIIDMFDSKKWAPENIGMRKYEVWHKIRDLRSKINA